MEAKCAIKTGNSEILETILDEL